LKNAGDALGVPAGRGASDLTLTLVGPSFFFPSCVDYLLTACSEGVKKSPVGSETAGESAQGYFCNLMIAVVERASGLQSRFSNRLFDITLSHKEEYMPPGMAA
jgi:hypothetical protein